MCAVSTKGPAEGRKGQQVAHLHAPTKLRHRRLQLLLRVHRHANKKNKKEFATLFIKRAVDISIPLLSLFGNSVEIWDLANEKLVTACRKYLI
jgi:hypothetical protein